MPCLASRTHHEGVEPYSFLFQVNQGRMVPMRDCEDAEKIQMRKEMKNHAMRTVLTVELVCYSCLRSKLYKHTDGRLFTDLNQVGDRALPASTQSPGVRILTTSL